MLRPVRFLGSARPRGSSTEGSGSSDRGGSGVDPTSRVARGCKTSIAQPRSRRAPSQSGHAVRAWSRSPCASCRARRPWTQAERSGHGPACVPAPGQRPPPRSHRPLQGTASTAGPARALQSRRVRSTEFTFDPSAWLTNPGIGGSMRCPDLMPTAESLPDGNRSSQRTS